MEAPGSLLVLATGRAASLLKSSPKPKATSELTAQRVVEIDGKPSKRPQALLARTTHNTSHKQRQTNQLHQLKNEHDSKPSSLHQTMSWPPTGNLERQP